MVITIDLRYLVICFHSTVSCFKLSLFCLALTSFQAGYSGQQLFNASMHCALRVEVFRHLYRLWGQAWNSPRSDKQIIGCLSCKQWLGDKSLLLSWTCTQASPVTTLWHAFSCLISWFSLEEILSTLGTSYNYCNIPILIFLIIYFMLV